MVALKTVPTTINDIEFATTQFPAMRALEVMAMLQGLNTAGVNPNASVSAAAPQLMAGLSGAALRKVVLETLQCTTALIRPEGGAARLVTLDRQENIDLIFSGRLKMLFQVIAHAVEVNFGDFDEGSNDPAPLILTQDQ